MSSSITPYPVLVQGSLSKGLYERDLHCLEEDIRWDPGNSDLYYNKGVMLRQLGCEEEALDCFDLAIKKSKNDSEKARSFLEKGHAHYSLGQNEEALRCYDSAIHHNDQAIQQLSLEDYYKKDSPKLELNRRSARCFYEKGFLLGKLEEHEKALDCFERAIRRDPSQASYHNQKGLMLWNLERHEEELPCYEKAIELDPQNPVFYCNKGNTLCKLGEYQKALDCSQAAIDRAKRDSDKAEYWLQKGNAYWKLGDHEKALECSKQASRYAPDNPKYQDDLAFIFSESQQHQEALVYLEKAIDRDPTNANYYRKKASIYLHLKKYEKALHCYEELFQNTEPQAQDFVAKANIYFQMARPRDAIRWYDKAITKEPDNPKLYGEKRKALQKLDCSAEKKADLLKDCEEQALRCYDIAIRKDPKNDKKHYEKGLFLSTLGRYQEAIDCFDAAILLNDKEALYPNAKGNAYQNQNKYEEAIPCYHEAIRLKGEDPVLHHNLANACKHSHRKTLPHYQRAVELAPQNGNYLLDLGDAFRKLNNLDQALACYEKAIELFSDPKKIAVCHNKRSLVFSKRGEHQKALECLHSAVQLDPESSLLSFNKGWALYALQQYEEALPYYESAIERNPQDLSFHKGKGNTLFALGRYQEAQEAYERSGSPSEGMAKTNEQLAIAKQELDAGWHEKAYDSFIEILKQQPKRFEALEGAFRANFENPEAIALLFISAGKLPFIEASYEQMVTQLIIRLPHKNLRLIQAALENLPKEPLIRAYLQSLEQTQDLKEHLDSYDQAPDWMKEDPQFIEAKEKLLAQIEREARNVFDLGIFYATKGAPHYRPDLALQQVKSAIGFYRRIPREKERLAFLSKILTDLEKDLSAFDREIDSIVEKILSFAQKPQIPKEASSILKAIVRDHVQPLRENPLYIGSLARIVGEQVKTRVSFRKKSIEVNLVAFEAALRSIFQGWQDTRRGPDAPPQEEQIEGAPSSTGGSLFAPLEEGI